MATVSGTFTAVGQSATLDVPALGEDITVSLTGGATATVLLQRETVPHADVWQTIRTYFGNVDASFRQERKNERYRFNVIDYTTGTVTYSVSDGDLAVDADSVITTTQAGATITGTLAVSGASTLTGAVTAAGTFTPTGDILGDVTFADGATDVDIASHDTTNGLKLGGTLVSATAAELNKLDGVGSTTAELNLVDGSSATVPLAGKAAILDSAGALRTLENVGAVPATVSAVEYGDGYNHVTLLTLTAAVFVVDVPADVEEVGALIYTFPTGVHQVHATMIDITAIALETNDPADCIFGVGSTLAAGDTVTFGAATDEDFIDGTAFDVTTINTGTPSVIAQAGDGTIFLTGDSKLFHLNIAGTWTDAVAAGEATVTGTVTIYWTFLGA